MKKVCVVGFGAIGPMHTEAIVKTKNAELFAVCDVIPERAETAKEKYGVKIYYDFDEMLADSEIDSEHICTLHHLHSPMVQTVHRNLKPCLKRVRCDTPTVSFL